MTLSGTAKISINSTVQKALDLNRIPDTLSITDVIVLSDTEGQPFPADQQWHDSRELATAASETLDLTASLVNAFGDTVSYSNIKVLRIKNTSAVDSLLIGAAAANPVPLFETPANDRLLLPPGGIYSLMVLHEDGLVLSGGDQLKLEHNGDTGAALTYEIVIIGNTTQPA